MSDARTRSPARGARTRSPARTVARSPAGAKSPARTARASPARTARASPAKSPARPQAAARAKSPARSPAKAKSADAPKPDAGGPDSAASGADVKSGISGPAGARDRRGEGGDALPSMQDAARGEEAMRRAKQAYLRHALVANGGLAALATPGELARMGVPRSYYAPLRRGSNLHVDADLEIDRKTAAFRDRLSRQLRRQSAAGPFGDEPVDDYSARGDYRYDDDDLHDDFHDGFGDDFEDYYGAPEGGFAHATRLPGHVLHVLRRRMAGLECDCGFGCGLGSGCLHLAALRRALLGCGGCSHCTECDHVASVLDMMRTCGQCSRVRQYRDEQGRVMFEI